METRQKVFSGLQPTGNIHIGNYLGALKNWVSFQDSYETVYCVVDLHAITVPYDPVEFRKDRIAAAKVLLAMGMIMLPPIIIALPFKIIFFVLVDGWFMIVGSLIKGFGV